TPRLLRTADGAAWVEHDGRSWRALTWVDGASTHAVASLAHAEAGGALVARFHRAVDDLVPDYRFVRAGLHDTASHLPRLQPAPRGRRPRALRSRRLRRRDARLPRRRGRPPDAARVARDRRRPRDRVRRARRALLRRRLRGSLLRLGPRAVPVAPRPQPGAR